MLHKGRGGRPGRGRGIAQAKTRLPLSKSLKSLKIMIFKDFLPRV
jgi:hypothetical protein